MTNESSNKAAQDQLRKLEARYDFSRTAPPVAEDIFAGISFPKATNEETHPILSLPSPNNPSPSA